MFTGIGGSSQCKVVTGCIFLVPLTGLEKTGDPSFRTLGASTLGTSLGTVVTLSKFLVPTILSLTKYAPSECLLLLLPERGMVKKTSSLSEDSWLFFLTRCRTSDVFLECTNRRWERAPKIELRSAGAMSEGRGSPPNIDCAS